ncbi:hypothetical protein [Selenomonas sp. FOBRC9]|uniref:hypothetical protein n=1 Tax=Selenomonas sp. FOBRC9 TaxID=936573 RepID=UPI0003061B4C|nr:hypothetical protein [Selenomonas sp. FOBRC9]
MTDVKVITNGLWIGTLDVWEDGEPRRLTDNSTECRYNTIADVEGEKRRIIKLKVGEATFEIRIIERKEPPKTLFRRVKDAVRAFCR